MSSDVEQQPARRPADASGMPGIRRRLAPRFLKLWVLLALVYLGARSATRYAVAGYAGLDGQALAETLLIPLFQALFLLALRETFRDWDLFRLSVQTIRRHPIPAIGLLLDLLVMPTLLWMQAFPPNPPKSLYVYFGVRCLFVSALAFSLAAKGKDRAPRWACVLLALSSLGLALKPLLGFSSSSIVSAGTLVFLVLLGATTCGLWMRRRPDELGFPAGLVVLSLPLVFVQALSLAGPQPVYYPWLWSTISIILAILVLDVVSIALVRAVSFRYGTP